MIRICLLQVSPPDCHGYCSLGTSVDCVPAALMHSKFVIGKFQIDSEQANRRLPA
jgi:acyl-CoA hydrolase